MSPENSKEIKISQKKSKSPRGRKRFLAFSLAGLLLTGCSGDFLDPPPLPTATPEPTLTPAQVAQICSEPNFYPRFMSYSQTKEISKVILNIEGPSNFPKDPMSRAMTLEGTHPSFSPNQKKVIYTSLSGGINIMDPDGQNLAALTNPLQGISDELSVWTPDGKKIIFERSDANLQKTELFSIDPNGQNLTQLTFNPSFVNDGRVVILKNNQIYFVKNDTRTGDSEGGYYSTDEVYSVFPDGKNFTHLKLDNLEYHTIKSPLEVSQDRSKIAFIASDSLTDFHPLQGGGYTAQYGKEDNKLFVTDTQGLARQIDNVTNSYTFFWSDGDKYLKHYALGNNGKLIYQLVNYFGTQKYTCPN